MLLAAGRGSRLRPITDQLPKPLLCVAGKPLIIHHIEKLAAAGFNDIVINVSWLGDQIEQALGNGEKFNITIHYSREQTSLETGGGIFNALPLLGPDPFFVINAVIYTDFPVASIPTHMNTLGHIILAKNPEHVPHGDYFLTNEGKICHQGQGLKFTFTGIGIYKPELFQDCVPGIFRLAKVFESAIAAQQLSGEIYQGLWCDVGTEARWHALEKSLTASEFP